MHEKNRFLPAAVLLISWTILSALVQGPPVSAQGAAITSTPASGPERRVNVLLYFGLYTQWYRIDEALKPGSGYALRTVNANSDGAEFIPTEEEISAFNVVVMSDVNRGSIKDAGLAVIDSFVKRGGGLLVLGGPFTYGEGKYEGSIFLDLLPVKKLGRFDLKWEKAGLPFSAVNGHAIFKGLDLSAKPRVFWIHEGNPKSGSSVVLKAGSRPLLVLGKHGQGRVAAFLGTPMGTSPKGQLPFWEWKGWPTLLRNTLVWLAGDR